MRRSRWAGLAALVSALLLLAPALADDVDTLVVDGKRYRLDGIDAPESDQSCLDREGRLYACSQAASAALLAWLQQRRGG